MSRTIQAPGLEVNEIDRSSYGNEQDNSIVDTTVFLMGFADMGQDYITRQIGSMAQFASVYGYPTNEAERYFYNAAHEVMERGGNLRCAKLPYDNASMNKFAFTTYEVDAKLTNLSDPYDIAVQVSVDTGKIPSWWCNQNVIEFLVHPIVDELECHEIFDILSVQTSVPLEFAEFVRDQSSVPYELYETFDALFRGYFQNNQYDVLLSVLQNPKEVLGLSAKYGLDDGSIVGFDELQKTLSTELSSADKWVERFARSKGLSYYVTQLEDLRDLLSGIVYDEDYSIERVLKTQSQGILETSKKQVLLVATRKAAKQFKVCIEKIIKVICSFLENELLYTKFTELKVADGSIQTYLGIRSIGRKEGKMSGMLEMETLDKLQTNRLAVQTGRIVVVDISRQRYQIDTFKNKNLEYAGILPVFTTAANALYVQNQLGRSRQGNKDYSPVGTISNVKSTNRYVYVDENGVEKYADVSNDLVGLNNDILTITGFSQDIGGENDVQDGQVTLSLVASSSFPEITTRDGHYDTDLLKRVGVVVYQMFVDRSNNNKISFSAVESFVGSLNRKAVDPITKASIFLDTMVNQGSRYIRFFSNVRFSENGNIKLYDADKASIFIASQNDAVSLGLYLSDSDKLISVKNSLNRAIDYIFDHNRDINTSEVDLVVDAGVSNIGQFIKSVYQREIGYYDNLSKISYKHKLSSKTHTVEWEMILKKYDDFCKNVRKDCMFIADAPRPFCLQGDEKLVRDTSPQNTIENQIHPKLKYISGVINTSYGAGYCNWFRCVDGHTGDLFWCPPSIKAAGVYLYTDAYSNYWNAPAGLNRGVLPNDVVDTAFNPTNRQSWAIYNSSWNYAMNYPINGIVIEGQKTFQSDKTAFDRVNVRRLFLGLESRVRYLSKFFIYEGITDYMMQRFVDTMSPIFDDAVSRFGIQDYRIVCDDRNNNANTIENNELHCAFGVKPVKSGEFIVLNFICTSQGASVEEVTIGNL